MWCCLLYIFVNITCKYLTIEWANVIIIDHRISKYIQKLNDVSPTICLAQVPSWIICLARESFALLHFNITFVLYTDNNSKSRSLCLVKNYIYVQSFAHPCILRVQNHLHQHCQSMWRHISVFSKRDQQPITCWYNLWFN